MRGKMSKKSWSKDERNFALKLYYKSSSAYKFLRNIQINLPGVSTIRRLISSYKFKPGLNSNILKQLTLKVGSISDEEKYCTLVFDEMKIKKFLEYSKYLDVVEGYEDLGTKRCSNALATQAMVFLIRGMYSSWKMPVSYFLSATSMKATTLSKLIVDHVQQLMNCGLKVRAIVCDQGPNNRSAFSKLNLTKEKPWFIVNNIKIFAIYDVPHLFKNLRNNLLSSDIICLDNKVSFSDIKQTYLIDKQSTSSRALLKITDSHINPGPFQKMSCKLALQIFNNTMSAAIKTCIKTGELKSSSALFTAEFITFVNNLFDCLNSRSLYSSNPYMCAISKERLKQLEFLESTKTWCQSLKKCSGHSRPYSFDGLEWTINAVINI